ncbi:MAG: zinc-finger domain-containing protein [Gammaproteobacteria bacterium]|nr:zinc-finger domain-containing protein [Gammaproteobacteria bacterium]NKB64533.1 zinc-finger domain-containing protein [Gammaproteobacteria bacterium]
MKVENKQIDSDQPNASQRVEVTAADLPLHCPMPDKRLWDSHPKVYLPIESSGKEACPYCGTVYVLNGSAGSSH